MNRDQENTIDVIHEAEERLRALLDANPDYVFTEEEAKMVEKILAMISVRSKRLLN